MSRIFVVDQERRPLMPCTPARARILLKQRKAAILRRFPLVLILREARPDAVVDPLRVKLDPGAKTSGIAVTNDRSGEVVWAAELTHRSDQIREALLKRRAVRRSRRQRHSRYRAKRFANRRRRAGWLAPSLLSRVLHLLTWVKRLQRWCPVGALSQELVRFDLQALETPAISGTAYQRGTLYECELREYVLARWEHRCVYCQRTHLPLQLDHVIPRSRGGSDRPSNLVPACQACNQQKGHQDLAVFLQDRPTLLAQIQAQLKAPLSDAAAVNSTRWHLYEALQATGLPVEVGTGGRTRWNRTRLGLPKAHWIDAACTGASTPECLHVIHVHPWLLQATGWQRRQMCLMSKHGFPRTRTKGPSRVQGLRTGDQVCAVVPKGSKAGTYLGRVAIRARGSFNLTTRWGLITDIAARFCCRLQMRDGYLYQKGGCDFLPIA